jgi:hypothetical protein
MQGEEEGCGLYELDKEVETEVDTPRAGLIDEALAVEVELLYGGSELDKLNEELETGLETPKVELVGDTRVGVEEITVVDGAADAVTCVLTLKVDVGAL